MAAGADAQGWQGLQEGMSEVPCHACPSPFRLGRDSHGRRELAPSHRDMVGLCQGRAGEGSRQRGAAWKEQQGLCLQPST